MSQRPARAAGMPWLSPYLSVQDADAALDFYQRAFGFEKRMVMPGPDGRTKHAEMTYHDMVIMFGTGGKAQAPDTTGVTSPVGLYLYCEDVDALYQRATAAGVKAVSPPTDMFYGDRVCELHDPDGLAWWFATNIADFDPSNVPH